jgi:hypothetical protein
MLKGCNRILNGWASRVKHICPLLRSRHVLVSPLLRVIRMNSGPPDQVLTGQSLIHRCIAPCVTQLEELQSRLQGQACSVLT